MRKEKGQNKNKNKNKKRKKNLIHENCRIAYPSKVYLSLLRKESIQQKIFSLFRLEKNSNVTHYQTITRK